MSAVETLRRLFDVIVKEAESNSGFAESLKASLDGEPAHGALPKRSGRRTPGVLDPFEVYGMGETVLRERLRSLGLEQLKDIVAEHGMDQAKLAMKWKTPERLVDLIVATVRDRARKGDAFRG